jgi:hypothetical protein
MSDEKSRNDVTTREIVYRVPGMETVSVQSNLEYQGSDGTTLSFDVYSQPGLPSADPKPVVVFVSGYPDPGFERMLGSKLKDTGQYVSWGRLVAASGLVAVTYSNREPIADLDRLLLHLGQHAAALGIDADRMGIWAGSGNVPRALSVVMQATPGMKCAVLCYGMMFDFDASTMVSDAAKQFGFVNPCAGKSVDDLPADVPLFVMRAGQDQVPGVKETVDRFVSAALARNLPITVANHPRAPHAFDVSDDSPTTREMIRRMVDFFRFELRVGTV